MESSSVRYYRLLLADSKNLLTLTQKKIFTVGTIRLIWIVAFFFTIYLIWNNSALSIGLVCLAGIIPFLYLMKIHNRLFEEKNFLESKISICNRELQLAKYDFDGIEGGDEFINADHDFSHDLDIFGKKSLFAYINRSATRIGKLRFANMLERPLTDKTLIKERQQAIEEMSKRNSLRIDFLAHGMCSKEEQSDVETISGLVAMPSFIPPMIIRWIVYALPFIYIGLFAGWMSDLTPGSYIVYLFLSGVVLASIYVKKVSAIQRKLNNGLRSLGIYALLIREMETNSFDSVLLQRLSKEVNVSGVPVSTRIKKLRLLLENLDQRYNVVGFAILNGFLLWDFRQLISLSKWLDDNRELLPGWLSAISEFDALSSLGTFRFNHEDSVFPEIAENNVPIMQAQAMGHPLIEPERCVKNEVDLPYCPSFLVITGANMAGKSTYLRTIGVNYLLASIGAPICAEKMNFTPFTLFTSLRTTDSLNDQESYFFAELKRLKQVVDRLKAGERLFIILDEILKGTNSADKQKGSLALIEQLVSLQGVGVIATHDLMLGSLAEIYPTTISNYRFEADIKGGELSFSYKLQPGIAQNMNACFLMEKMGIIPKNKESKV